MANRVAIQSFAEWVLCRQHLEVGQRTRDVTNRKQRVDPTFEHLFAQLGELRGRGRCGPCVADNLVWVGEGLRR